MSARRAPPRFDSLVLTCEHATNAVPARYRSFFRGQSELLSSHRGWDPGAAVIAKRLAKAFDAPLFLAEVSRLVIDHNRSLDHPRLSLLPESEHAALARAYYLPYRRAATAAVTRAAKRGRVLHIAMHSFTPVMNGVTRIAELGLLYDPKRPLEAALCSAWREELAHNDHGWRVRRNYPYAGWTDGFTTVLRRELPASCYAGVEIELNQALAQNARDLAAAGKLLEVTLRPFVAGSS